MARLALAAFAVSAVPAVEAQEPLKGEWTRKGLEIVWLQEQPPVLPRHRIEAQREAGCEQGLIRFGETAVMRGALPDMRWPPDVLDAVASAAAGDNHDEAIAALESVLSSEGLDPLGRAVLENQLVLTHLQFGQADAAKRRLVRLEEHGAVEPLPGPVLADRLFWSVLAAGPSADRVRWRQDLLPRLDEALGLDPSHFGVRFQRLAGWLASIGPVRPPDCRSELASLATIVLDVSEASACPLLIGHAEHALSRTLAGSGRTWRRGEGRTWRAFATALLAVVMRNDAVAASALREIGEGIRDGHNCASLMSNAIERELEALR